MSEFGLGPERLAEIAAAAGGPPYQGRLDGRRITTHWLPAVHSDFDPATSQALATEILTRAGRTALLVLDLNFSSLSSSRVLRLVETVLRTIAIKWPTDARALLLVAERVPQGHGLAALLQMPQYAHKFTIAECLRDGFVRSDDQRVNRAALERSASTQMSDLVRRIADRSVRRRGVFEVVTAGAHQNAMHRHSADHVTDELCDALVTAVRQEGYSAVFWDDETSDWLGEAVQSLTALGATAGPRVGTYPLSMVLDEVSYENADLRAWRDELERFQKTPSRNLLVVVPLVKSGDRIARLRDTLIAGGAERVDFFAVFVDKGKGPARRDGELMLYEIPDAEIGGLRVWGLVEVGIDRVSSVHDWRIRAAKALNAVEEGKDTWRPPNELSSWMLLRDPEYAEDIGYGDDFGTGERSVRLKLDLNRWDSYWIATALLKLIREDCPVNPDHLLLIAPDDPDTAVRSISKAMRERIGVQMLTVDRKRIVPGGSLDDHDRSVVGHYGAKSQVVLVDESRVTGKTLERLAELVEEAGGEVARAVVVFDLHRDAPHAPPGPAGVPFEALFGWRPMIGDRGHG